MSDMSAVKLSGQIAFSEEQSMLLDTATEFFRSKSALPVVRELLTNEAGYDASQWQEMVDLGWLGLAVPEEFGGSELGLGAAVTIAEPMGRHLSATPFLSTQLFVQGLLAADENLKPELLAAVVGGAVGCVALFESNGNWHLDNPTAQLQVSGAQAKLSGTKTLVLDAASADYVLVLAAQDGKPTLVVVPTSALPAGAIQRETVIDETRRSFQLDLTGVEVPADHVLTASQSVQALEKISAAAWLLLSAESAGGIAGVLDLLVEYLNTRLAFGRKIGSYQGLKHPTVDILIGLERSRSHVYHAATLLDAGESAQTALRMAKAESSDSFAFAGDRAIQFHGGFGFTYDCDAQLFLRRALWTQASFGDSAHHRKRLASMLL